MKLLKRLSCSFALMALPLLAQAQNGNELFRDMNAPQHERILDLLSRLTVEEKISLLVNDARAISRLNIDKYNHGNEALHGIVRPGEFTVFPQAIGLAAMWNPELLHEVSSAISDEARGRWKELDFGKKQLAGASDLLTFWSPTVNMARDPRWGRTPETYGEDPYLSGVLGTAFVTGLQGDHPRYLKSAFLLYQKNHSFTFSPFASAYFSEPPDLLKSTVKVQCSISPFLVRIIHVCLP